MRTQFIANAIKETRREIKKTTNRIHETVSAYAINKETKFFLKPTYERNNTCWFFNEYVAGRLCDSLGISCLPPFIIQGLEEHFPWVGIPYIDNVTSLKDYLTDKSKLLNSFENWEEIFSIIAFDICVFNSDRAKVNLFLVKKIEQKTFIVSCDHEKSFLGNGLNKEKGDLHRITGNPKEKNVGDFFQKWLRTVLLETVDKETLKKNILKQIKSFSKILPTIFPLVLEELPSQWLENGNLQNNIKPLNEFLNKWWCDLPEICEKAFSKDCFWSPTKGESGNAKH